MTKLSDYDYQLPESLIAHYPPKIRGTSRLLVAEKENINDHSFPEIINFLNPNDLLIINNTRVIPARIFGEKATGGQVEIMLERILDPSTCIAQLKANRALKEGQEIHINGQASFTVIGRDEGFFTLKTINQITLAEIMEASGHLPLPPYINREDNANDKALDLERYQTVFSKEKGAVAAPTAGLHFTQELMNTLKQKGITIAEITLHVGAGTFQPIRTDEIDQHTMHKEWISIPQEVITAIKRAKAAGGRIIAVGTTVVRALESLGQKEKLASKPLESRFNHLEPYQGDTHIFIKPGFTFTLIDGLITNFHLPKSTLLVLVSTFMGKERIQAIYQHAIKEKYQFYSYGDAMLLLP